MAARPVALEAQVAELTAALQGDGLPDDPAALISLIGQIETLKSAACAAQAAATVAYDAGRRRAESEAGVAARRQGRGVAAEVALARRESPHRGHALVGLAKVLHTEMPHTRRRLADGTLNEFRAMLLARETACLSAEHRAFVDEELCADPAAIAGLGTRKLVARAKKLSYELDPASIVRRARRAEGERTVTTRPAPDTMGYLTALLPVAQCVSAYAALRRDVDAIIASGDLRSRGQLMADLLVSRLTGADLVADAPTPVPVTINLTMPAATLAGGHAAAEVGADGVVPDVLPAEIARHLASRAVAADLTNWIRRLFVDSTGRLVSMTSKQRFFTEGLADFLTARDLGICRTPYCDAPIRHRDHVVPASEGGATTAHNGQGTCEACNHAKQAPGWQQRPVDDLRHAVETITPSGHRYLSHAPPPVGWREPRWVRDRPGVYTLVA